METNWRRQRGGKTGGELLGGLVRCLRVSRSVFLPAHRSELRAERASQLSRAWGMLDMKHRQLEHAKLVQLFCSRREKIIVRPWWLMVNLPVFFSFSKFHFGHFTVCHSPCHLWSEWRWSTTYVLPPIIYRWLQPVLRRFFWFRQRSY